MASFLKGVDNLQIKKKKSVTPTPYFQSHINSVQYKIKFENLIASQIYLSRL